MTPQRLTREQLIGANFSFQHYPLADVARVMRDSGRDAIELWGIAPHLDLFHDGEAHAAAVRQMLADHGLTVHCFTPEQVVYPINIASGNDDYRAASIARFCRAAEMAATLGARYLFLTPGRGFESEPAARAWDRSVEALRRIVDHAEALGLRCLLEPLQRRETNLARSAADLARMLGDIGSDAVDVVLDTVAMAAAGDGVDDYFRLFGRRVAHVHLVDGNPAGHLVWGDGTLPLGEYLGALSRHGYRGRLSFEPFGDGGYALDPALAWRRNLAAFDAWLAEGAA